MMKPHTIVLALVLFVVILFAGVNWGLFAREDTISFVFFSVRAPFGVIMLGIVGVVSLLYMVFIARAEIAGLMEVRKKNRELEEVRTLAMNSEKSRVTEMQNMVAGRMDELGGELIALKERFGSVERRVGDIVRRFDEEGVFIVRGAGEEDGDVADGTETKK